MNTLPVVRPDLLPENTRYLDSGCSVAPSCLTCPLPRCRYDDPRGTLDFVERDRAIFRALVQARKRGRQVAEVAARFGVSERTVHRVGQRRGVRRDLAGVGDEPPLKSVGDLRPIIRPRRPLPRPSWA